MADLIYRVDDMIEEYKDYSGDTPLYKIGGTATVSDLLRLLRIYRRQYFDNIRSGS